MKTYKQTVFLAGISTALATNDSFFSHYLDEGEECRLWWNSWAGQPICREGLECLDRGAESINGFGICDDLEKLG